VLHSLLRACDDTLGNNRTQNAARKKNNADFKKEKTKLLIFIVNTYHREPLMHVEIVKAAAHPLPCAAADRPAAQQMRPAPALQHLQQRVRKMAFAVLLKFRTYVFAAGTGGCGGGGGSL
jgi:hypothetical protein